MKPIIFSLKIVPVELRQGLREIVRDHAARFASRGGLALAFQADSSLPEEGLRTSLEGGAVVIRYRSRSGALRALGRLLAARTPEELVFTEVSPFTLRGLMIDCSRNGVMTVEALQAFLRRVSLMGINMFMLYTEDTYEVPGEPFFGYLRGAYSQRELKAIDDYAHSLGIELIPCIQTLAHLEQILQWPTYREYRDTEHILLPGYDKTYDLIRKMIRAATASVRSGRIHIGMDEAHGLGTGRYREIFGERRAFDIMNEHLGRVRDICADEGLRPMIWSDMYFRLGSRTHSYYDMNWQIPDDVIEKIPRDVQLVYWDYYHDEPETYRKMIGFHRRLGVEPIMAGGIWTWPRFWCALPWTFKTISACLAACRAEGLREVFMTMWGDDGMEVDLFSALPGVQFFCEQAFAAEAALDTVQQRFEAICGCAFEPWIRAADLDLVPGIANRHKSRTNAAKGLLWQDPALAILDPHIRLEAVSRHYRQLADELSRAANGEGLAARLGFPAAIARTLARKVPLRQALATALKTNNRRKLRMLAERDLPGLIAAVQELWKCHRRMWMATYKPFGWEVIENRYGGLLARLQTVRDRVQDYLSRRTNSLPELTAKLLDPWPEIKDDIILSTAARVRTPSYIK
ncbi:MAG: beta-N-acetylhexosaminidase [Kiritimatiellia bacterium]